MNRKRKNHRGLPARVYVKDRAYQFLSPEKIKDPKDGKLKFWIRLADYRAEGDKNVPAMLNALAKLMNEHAPAAGAMPHLCAEYKAKKLGRYEDETRAQYSQYLDKIADDFEHFSVAQVTTKSCADFLRTHFSDKPNTARKYGALMARLFRYAISALGLREDNPMDQIDLDEFEVERRTVLASHHQIAAIRAAGAIGKDGRRTQSGPMFACIIDMTYLLWARAVDIRTLKESQIDEAAGVIRIQPGKTRKSSGLTVDIAITPEIQEVIDRARAVKRDYAVISPFLFPTKEGGAYAKSGLTTMWDRARERAIEAEAKQGREFGERIQFKDLRSLAATDAAKRGEQKAEIQKRLVHTNAKTTEIYIKESVPETSSMAMKLPWKNR